MDHSTVRRLAFIRYLLETAVEQSRRPAPLNCGSILTAHDAVELFLQLASEELNTGTGHPGFMDYWDLLNPKLDPQELSQKESMRRLNKARVALKHHGTLPSSLDVEAFRASAISFFEENTPLVFGVELGDVSLVEFVSPDEARELLSEAQALINAGEPESALDKIAVAYSVMISDYEDRKRDRFGRSPFFFGRSLTFHNAFFMGIDRLDRKLGQYVDYVKESIEAMQDAIKVMALGIDYRKYSKFKKLVPLAQRTVGGKFVLQRMWREGEAPSVEDAQFCLGFVVESALALAEFDYSTNEEWRA